MRQLQFIIIIFLKASTSVMIGILILIESIVAYDMPIMVIVNNILSSLNYLLDLGLIMTNLPKKEIEKDKD